MEDILTGIMIAFFLCAFLFEREADKMFAKIIGEDKP